MMGDALNNGQSYWIRMKCACGVHASGGVGRMIFI